MKREENLVGTLSIDDYLDIVEKEENYKKNLSINPKKIQGSFSSNKEGRMRSRTMNFNFKPQNVPKPKPKISKITPSPLFLKRNNFSEYQVTSRRQSFYLNFDVNHVNHLSFSTNSSEEESEDSKETLERTPKGKPFCLKNFRKSLKIVKLNFEKRKKSKEYEELLIKSNSDIAEKLLDTKPKKSFWKKYICQEEKTPNVFSLRNSIGFHRPKNLSLLRILELNANDSIKSRKTNKF